MTVLKGPAKWWIALALAIAVIAIIRPWTVRPINAVIESEETVDQPIQAADIWSAQIPGAAYQTVLSTEDFGASPALISGSGKVIAIDRSSRAGLALVDFAPFDGTAGMAIQIGPVIRGTALRDALGFGFSDFASQRDYARFADALNQQARQEIPALNDADQLSGQLIRFTGALSGGDKSPRELTPITIEIEK